MKNWPTRTASQHQNPRSVSTTQIPLVMLFQATRQMASEEDNTSATHVAHLHQDRRHTCNAEPSQNDEPADKDRLTTPKSTFRQHNTNTPCHAIQATRQMASEEDNTSATHVAYLRHDRKHTCNAEPSQNEEPDNKNRLTTP